MGGRTFGVGAAALVLLVSGCARQAEPDAYGNVEVTEVVVSSEAAGQLTSFAVEEGQVLAAGAAVGVVDPTQLELQRGQLTAQRDAAASRINEVASQVQAFAAQRDGAQAQREAAVSQRAALQAQLEIAERVHARTTRLIAQQAATAQQLDQAERDDRVLRDQVTAQDRQIDAATHQVAVFAAQMAAADAQRQTALRQVTAAASQVAQVGERLRKSSIVNPGAGTVLVRYAEQGEVVQPGQPLYKVADLGTVDVRAYVTEPQLASLRLGQAARVTVDVGKGRQTVGGTLSWVSAQAEFTPTPIQTRDERADLVYAVKIRVPNQDGALKIGMPVDVAFSK